MEQFLECSDRRSCLPLRLWMCLILSVSSLESRLYHSQLFNGLPCSPRQLWGGKLGLQCALLRPSSSLLFIPPFDLALVPLYYLSRVIILFKTSYLVIYLFWVLVVAYRIFYL